MVFFVVPGVNFDLASFSFQVPICGSEVNTPIDSAQCRFLCCIETSCKAAIHARQKIGAGCKGQIFCAVKQWKHSRSSSAERAMARDVIREGWRHDKRHPVQFRFDESNCGDRAPEVERVLCVPGTNSSVRHRDV